MNRYLKTRGFTLIELLVVIAIIGILSSVVLASLNSAREKSRDAARISDVKQLQLALELYFDSEGEYPADLATLATDGFIPNVPNDPQDNAYAYGRGGTGNSDYRLGITLEDDEHSALDNAVSTDAYGVSCDAAGEYCVAP